MPSSVTLGQDEVGRLCEVVPVDKKALYVLTSTGSPQGSAEVYGGTAQKPSWKAALGTVPTASATKELELDGSMLSGTTHLWLKWVAGPSVKVAVRVAAQP